MPQPATRRTTTTTTTAPPAPQSPATTVLLSILLSALACIYIFYLPSSSQPPKKPHPPATMSWSQSTFTLPPQARGSYLITDHILSRLTPQISDIKIGLLHLFIQHTSCALSLNENWDSDVQLDMTDALERVVPYDRGGKLGLYRHDAEGEDDMPAHVKSALVGASVSVPIKDGRLALGTWQGIWYLEFRRARHTRTVVATIQGERMK
ncbi:hypothetical protein DFH27DRAFT_59220 [Peziza echinospora]|nr:hypothetical protein DFH27DRAFT_59220 [Peziza echinospora]